MVQDIFSIIRRINREEGVAMLLVEQNAHVALGVADYGYILENGRIVIDGSTDKLLGDPDVQRFYLGSGGDEGQVSFPRCEALQAPQALAVVRAGHGHD